MIMGVCLCTALELSKMQNQKWLTLHGRSFLKGGSDIVACLLADKGDEHHEYSPILLRSPAIIQDARLEIGDAMLTLSSRMGQRACPLPLDV